MIVAATVLGVVADAQNICMAGAVHVQVCVVHAAFVAVLVVVIVISVVIALVSAVAVEMVFFCGCYICCGTCWN